MRAEVRVRNWINFKVRVRVGIRVRVWQSKYNWNVIVRYIFSEKNKAIILLPVSNDSSIQVDFSDTYIDLFLKIFGLVLRGQRSKGPYGKSKFQNENFLILKADLESLQKSMNVKCFSFFNIYIGTLSKFTLKMKIESKFNFHF